MYALAPWLFSHNMQLAESAADWKPLYSDCKIFPVAAKAIDSWSNMIFSLSLIALLSPNQRFTARNEKRY